MRTGDHTAPATPDITEMVRRLEAARGDAHELALVTLDIILSGEDAGLRETLEAAAVPHWFDARILGALLDIDADAAAARVEQLSHLTAVEPFRAHAGWNVHEATRLGLRKRLRREQPARFAACSARAAALFPGDTASDRVERIYHRLTASPVEAIQELSDLWVEWDRASLIEPLQALGTVLSELLAAGSLEPLARGRALVTVGQIRSSRLSSTEYLQIANEAAGLMRECGDEVGLADAQHMMARALVTRGQLNDAARVYTDTREILERLLASHPDDVNRLSDLANVRADLGNVWRAHGRIADAQAEFDLASSIRRQLVEREPASTRWKYELGVSCVLAGQHLLDAGNMAGALAELRQGIGLFEELLATNADSPDWERELAVARNSVGVVLRFQGDMRGAASEFEASRRVMERLARLDPEHTTWRRDLQVAHSLLGSMLLFQGNLEAAVEEYRTALRISEELVALDPDNAGFWDNLSTAHSDLGSAFQDLGSLDEALKHHTAAKTIAADLVEQEPENGTRRASLASAHGRLGAVYEQLGRLNDSLAEHRAALAMMSQLTAEEPDSLYWLGQLAACHNAVGGVLSAQGMPAEALAEYTAARAIRERQTEREPDNTAWQMGLAVAHRLTARVQRAQQQYADALTSSRASKEILEALVAKDPDNTDWLRQLSIAHSELGSLFMAAAGSFAAVPDIDQAQHEAVLTYGVVELAAARDIMIRLTELDPGNTSWRYALATSHTEVGGAFSAVADWIDERGARPDLPPAADLRERSLESYANTRAIMVPLCAQDPMHTGWQRALSIAHYRIGRLLETAGRNEEALAAFEADLAIAERLAQLDPTNANWRQDLETTRAQLAKVRGRLVDDAGSVHNEPGRNGRDRT